MTKCTNMDDCFYGAATVGERGQIVIPSEAREELGIKPGDKLLVIRHPTCHALMVAKIDALQGFIQEFARGLERLESNQSSEDEE